MKVFKSMRIFAVLKRFVCVCVCGGVGLGGCKGFIYREEAS